MRVLFSLFFSLLLSLAYAGDSLRIAVISDVHFLASELAGQGKALQGYEEATGRNVNDLHAVLNEMLDSISNAKPDVLLIAGDITNHGEKASHAEFIKKIEPLKNRGVHIFVIPGNHDVNVPDAKAYNGNESTPAAGISKQDFEALYAPFGYATAMKRDKVSLSYLTALSDSVWLLCLDTNRYAEYKTSSISGGRILPETLSWALDILREAKQNRITVLGMMHHGLVEHMPYQSVFFPDYLVDDWENMAKTLADEGLQIVFTGHFHSNDITSFATPNGNVIFDIETGSLAQYPFPYRLMTLKGKSLLVDTHFIRSIPGKPGLEEEYRQRMEALARKTIAAKLKNMGIPVADQTREALTDLLVRMSLLHARGDETLDEHMLQYIVKFAAVMGNDSFDANSFQLDFPPADNHLIINMK